MGDLSFGLSGLAGPELSALGGGMAGGLLSRFANYASLGGVSFAVIDSKEEIGRRINRVLFPDLPPSKQVFQDFGAIDTPITITGVIVGDDYVIRATRMRKTLAKPGRMTLLHPWWGRLKVRLVHPAQISFSERQIRVAHFQAVVVRDPDPPAKKGFFGSLIDTVNDLLEQADGLMDDVQEAVASVLSAVSLPLALVNSVSSLISQGSGIWDSLTERAPEPIKAAMTAPQAAMNTAIVPPQRNIDQSYANAVSAALIAVPASLAGCVSTEESSVIAPVSEGTDRDGTADNEPITGQQIASLLLAGSEQFGQLADRLSQSNPDPSAVLALGVAARAVLVSQLASAWADCVFVSNEDAQALLTQITDAIDGLTNDVVAASGGQTRVALQPLFTRLQKLRCAFINDGSAQIGSLPTVVDVPVAVPRSLWALTYALQGDDVSTVQPMLDDAVSRNAILHPGHVGPTTLAMLENDNEF
ncbi:MULTISPECIES: DNA circularization N-terminal domain-containing protein [unclassified Saccharibacter]|uniref:DNA circularization N-terminal domain-containing protein n=1 Tax=unclassified Saccharibacter TaxID=2648722 RepID=UPI00132248AD|nr:MULTISPECIES: DNA circularization N-terminal domain-containing protein [unclassified Saccharibacter]MXV35845.1 hypothetical protein [Saccharibacter sp. EH611]MXV57966.1 hypothetical protein [Saccharibacter sp. EH70]MXV66361.1 hypothetical protein [Saccharibacter sp. EH60]